MQPQMPEPWPIGDVEDVEIGARRQQLERVGRNAEHEVAMKGGHGDEAAFGGDPHRFLARRLEVVAVLDELGAERAHRRVLLARIAARNIDAHREPGARAGEGEALAVVAARRRDDAFGVRVAPLQRVDEGQPAAHLEGAGRIVVLVLDHRLGAEPPGDQRPGDRRRRRQRRADDRLSAPQLVET